MSYANIALPLAQRGVPTIPLRPRSKVAFIHGWEEAATVDPHQIKVWDAQYPDANGASVAQGKLGGVWFFEIDSPEVLKRIETETGQKIPSTYRVRSSPGRGHFYFRQTPESIAMGNISQGFVKNTDWSARVDRQYVVAPGSIHPKTGDPYTPLREEPIIDAPQWLLNWLQSQKVEKKTLATTEGAAPVIAEGGRNTWLTREAGKLRQASGLNEDELAMILLRKNQESCIPPLSEEEVKTIAGSIARYEVKQAGVVLVGGVPAGTNPVHKNVQSAQVVQNNTSAPTPEERPKFAKVEYPRFPTEVMYGTSVYEYFVKPVTDVNSRVPEFMWLPAVQIMLNYLTLRVHIKDKNFKGNLYSVIIGKKGSVKSDSVKDAIHYMTEVGIADHAGMDTQSAQGKALVWSAGSPEGLGLDMHKTNCKNAILFYDELSTLTKKAGIDGSNMVGALLTMYESGKFANAIKAKKDSYGLQPGTYATSLISCTTDETFKPLWAILAGATTGLNDRFIFLLQPEMLPEPTPQIVINTDLNAVKTKELVDKAVKQGIYSIFDQSPLRRLYKLDNRYGHRAEKFALYFAVDLGKDEIDEECIERACMVVDYEIAVKKYLQTYDAVTREGVYQQELISLLKNSGGEMKLREIERKMNSTRFGTGLWYQIYEGLKKASWIKETGAGVKGDPKIVYLMKDPDGEDD